MKEATVRARIESQLKVDAENVLSKLGLTSAEVIRLLYSQIVLQQALPFTVKLPNDETLKAIEEIETGVNLETFKNSDDWFKDINK